ncbi:YczE/YyaS/YitT family protein [Streptoalloteichus tenebrarius]|uniref:YczE/YyaS/YitT family protein n=1 Tax=Streptoalloteichus tenebrarius (strain ATCC 17920 / DSM 40477 / JCM 4838 / CBS 697.72 / NBRC 16177 / NCIMB 11028 / NRRL B-12390 / A12253. 1 / ISP 5477) TaxID=1933 RepID=UPI0020A45A70|nr:hypothetical protein [Streptoalloteichus tenebrarius]BFF02954.1 membrane protein [Streptoalloteichus tenebrarius]
MTYLSGCLVFSAGAYLFVHSRLGTDPLDVFSLGLLRHVPLTVGLVQAGVAVLCLAVVALWTRRRPALSPLLTFFACGSLIDLLMWGDPARGLGAWPALALGVALCAEGSALILMSGFGVRAMDLLALVVSARWRWPFWLAKGAMETALLLTGWALGGPVGVGTLCFLVGVDLLIQPLVRLQVRAGMVDHSGVDCARRNR